MRQTKAETIEAKYFDGCRLLYVVNAFIEGIPVAAVVVRKEECPGEFGMEHLPRGDALQFDFVDVHSSRLAVCQVPNRRSKSQDRPKPLKAKAV